MGRVDDHRYLGAAPERRAVVELVGQRADGGVKGADKDFRNGMTELEDQLDGAGETKLHRIFPKR